MKTNIISSSYTALGSRQVNEDSLGHFASSQGDLFVLCDGLGGHGMGEIASALVVRSLGESFDKYQGGREEEFLRSALEKAQDELLLEQQKQNARRGMKTTAVLLLIRERAAWLAHIGDSRLYVFRKNKVWKRTLDHSIPQMLALAGEIRESDIRQHPERSSLLRVMGTEWDGPPYEIDHFSLRKCQAFLLCSDGFWELIEEAEMERLLEESAGPEEWLKKMRSSVMSAGADREMDNNTAIAVWCERP